MNSDQCLWRPCHRWSLAPAAAMFLICPIIICLRADHKTTDNQTYSTEILLEHYITQMSIKSKLMSQKP